MGDMVGKFKNHCYVVSNSKHMFIYFSFQKTEQELTLYPNKNGNISLLLEEAKQHLKVDGPLRLLELMSSKIFVIYRPDQNMDHLTNATQKSYRIEEIPPDQIDIR